MKRQNLVTAERLRKLLHYDPETGVFRWLVAASRMKIGNVAGTFDSDGYRQIQIDGRKYGAHRLAWLYMTDAWPSDQVDHENLDKADNRLENIRESTYSQNQGNTRTRMTNTSGYKGIYWEASRGKWRAGIKVTGRNCFLGRFTTPEAAHAAYCEAAGQYFGGFARTA